MSQDPFQEPYKNPYQSTIPGSRQVTDGNPLQVPAIILIVLSSLWFVYGIFNVVVAISMGPPELPPNPPPGMEAGQNIGFYGAAFAIPVFGLFCLIGSICMLRLKGFAMAMTGAIMGVVPVCGPCLVVAIPFSIWAIVLLARPEVRAKFS